jgi:hypothetical protein
MDAMWHSTAIQKIDDDRVTDLGAYDRSQDTQPVGLRFVDRKTGIGVLDVTCFVPLRLSGPWHWNLPAIQNILSAWGVVPRNVLSCEVIMACGRHTNWRHRKEHQERKPTFHEGITQIDRRYVVY